MCRSDLAAFRCKARNPRCSPAPPRLLCSRVRKGIHKADTMVAFTEKRDARPLASNGTGGERGLWPWLPPRSVSLFSPVFPPPFFFSSSPFVPRPDRFYDSNSRHCTTTTTTTMSASLSPARVIMPLAGLKIRPACRIPIFSAPKTETIFRSAQDP